MTFSQPQQFVKVQMSEESPQHTKVTVDSKSLCALRFGTSYESKEPTSLGVSGNSSTEDLLNVHYKIFTTLLEQVAQQRCRSQQCHPFSDIDKSSNTVSRRSSSMVVDEITEMIEVDGCCNSVDEDSSFSSIEEENLPLSLKVQAQLRLFLSQIASLYHSENPFHNFEHASHVTFSAYQLIRRLSTKDLPHSEVANSTLDPWEALPKHEISSCAFASDALAQFAILFSALIHDVDHSGVPNATLVKEETPISQKYMNKSVAEQNSVDMAWAILESTDLQDLRDAIFPTQRDYDRFRTMVVNIVMATDIADASLKSFHELKWQKSFGDDTAGMSVRELRNRRVTVTMDLIMMASDISHAFQPFDVFCKWNRRLYFEMYKTFHEGRSAKDPSEFWFKGEFFFFDKHIIPLAQRLKMSGVFGEIADHLLSNAKNNRALWEEHGEGLVAQMKTEAKMISEQASSSQETKSSIFGSFMQLCCRGSKPMYLRANTYEDDDCTARHENEGSEFEDEPDVEDYRYSFRMNCFRSSRTKKL